MSFAYSFSYRWEGRRRFVSRSSEETTPSYNPTPPTNYGRRTSVPVTHGKDYSLGSTLTPSSPSYVHRSNTFDNSMSSPFTLQTSPSYDIGRPTSTRIGRSHSTDLTEYNTPKSSSRRVDSQSSDTSFRPSYSQYYPNTSSKSRYGDDTSKYENTSSIRSYNTRKYSDSAVLGSHDSSGYHDNRLSNRLRDRTCVEVDRQDVRNRIEEAAKTYRPEDLMTERRPKKYNRRSQVLDSDSEEEDPKVRHPPRRKGQRSPRTLRKTDEVQDLRYQTNLGVDSAYIPGATSPIPSRRSPVGGVSPSTSRKSPVGSKSPIQKETSPSFHYARSSKPSYAQRESADGMADSPSASADSPRKMAIRSTRSKTADLGSILSGASHKNGEYNQEKIETFGDEESRAERIARYKADRRKQLADKFGNARTETLEPGSRFSRHVGSTSDETKGEKPGGVDSSRVNRVRDTIREDLSGFTPKGVSGLSTDTYQGSHISHSKKETTATTSDGTAPDGAIDPTGRRVSSSSVSESASFRERRERRRYIRRDSSDSERLDEKRRTAGDIANDLAVLEAKMEARARRRREKADARKSDLNKVDSTDGRTSESSILSEDPRARGVSPRGKTTPVTSEEYNQALDISEGQESDKRVPSLQPSASATRQDKITAILSRFSYRRMVEQKISQERESPEDGATSAGKDDQVQKQIKLYTAGNRDVSEKVKKLTSPEQEKEAKDVTSPLKSPTSPKLHSPREVTSPTRSPLKVTPDDKTSPVRPSHLFTFAPATNGARPAQTADVSPPGKLFLSKEDPIRLTPEGGFSKPVRRTSSLRDSRRRPNKFTSSDTSSGPDEELSRILSARKGTIENQIEGQQQSPTLNRLDLKFSPRNSQHTVNSDRNIESEELKKVLRLRRARSESVESDSEAAPVQEKPMQPILKRDSHELEKEPIPILRKKSPDEKQTVVKIQEPVPILRRRSLENVEAVPILRRKSLETVESVPILCRKSLETAEPTESSEPAPILRRKSLDADEDSEEPISILKNKEEPIVADSSEPLHSILKHKEDDGKRPSILKQRNFVEIEETFKDDSKPASILKKRDSLENTSSATSSPMRSRRNSGEDTRPASILKRREPEEQFERRSSEPEIRMTSILKKRDSGDSEKAESASSSRRGSCEDSRPISILKKRDSIDTEDFDVTDGDDMKPILKRRDRSQSPVTEHAVLSPCSIESLEDKPLTSILKRPSLEEAETQDEARLQSIMKHKDSFDRSESPERQTVYKKRADSVESKTLMNLPEFLSQISDRSSKDSPLMRGRSSSLTEKTVSGVAKLSPSAGQAFSSMDTSFSLHVADYSPSTKSGRPVRQKSHTVQVLDTEELSKALKARRQEESDEETEEKTNQRSLSAAEEIKLIRSRAEERWEDVDDPVSVQARIFEMETKADDALCSPLRSQIGSGLVTPKLKPVESVREDISPKFETKLGSIPQSQRISDEQLMAKLTDVAQEPLIARRKQTRERYRSWRSATTPVTEEELAQANSLASVAEFRCLIKDKASSRVLQQLLKLPAVIPGVRKLEYPQHIKVKSRRSLPRYKTQPITKLEISVINVGDPFYSVLKIDVPSSSYSKGQAEGTKVRARLEIRPPKSHPTRDLTSSIPAVQVIKVDGATTSDTEIDTLLPNSADGNGESVLSDQEIQDIEKEFEKLFDLTEDEDKDPKDDDFENILTKAEKDIKQPMLGVEGFIKEKSPRLGRDKSPRRDRDKMPRKGKFEVTPGKGQAGAEKGQVSGVKGQKAHAKSQVSGTRGAEVELKAVTAEKGWAHGTVTPVETVQPTYQRPVEAPVAMSAFPADVSAEYDAPESDEPREVIAWDRTAELDVYRPLPPTVIDLAETKEHHTDEKAKLSIFEKASIFAKGTADAPVKKVSARRFAKRDIKEKRERSRTQPITPDEVKEAFLKGDESSTSRTDSDDVTASSSAAEADGGKLEEVKQEIEQQKVKDDLEVDPLAK